MPPPTTMTITTKTPTYGCIRSFELKIYKHKLAKYNEKESGQKLGKQDIYMKHCNPIHKAFIQLSPKKEAMC